MPEQTAPPPVGLGHMAMTVADLAASHRFYAALGLRPLGEGGGLSIFELRGGTHLLLFQRGGPAEQDETTSPFDQPPAERIDLMLAGRTREDLDAYRTGLVAQGLSPEPIMNERFFGHFVFRARDPDGCEVVVSTSHASQLPI